MLETPPSVLPHGAGFGRTQPNIAPAFSRPPPPAPSHRGQPFHLPGQSFFRPMARPPAPRPINNHLRG